MSDLSKLCSRLGDQAAPVVLSARLHDLEAYWLELHCCAGMTLLPVRLILKRRLDVARLSEIMPALTCRICGSPPRQAWLNETHHRVACGGPEPGWSVQLIPRADELAAAAE